MNWTLEDWMGSDKKGGILPVATQGVGALMQGWAGLQGIQNAKRQQAFNEQMSATNLANQAALTNERLYTRQQSRYASNPNRFAAPDAFMKQWGVSGKIGG